MTSQLFTSPTYQPVTPAPSYPQPPPGAEALPSFARRPLIQPISWLAANSVGAGAGGTVIVTVTEPTLIRINRVTPAVASTSGLTLDLLWRPYSGNVEAGTFYLAWEAGGRIPFIGPYAWITEPGQYELAALAVLNPAGAQVQIQGDMIRGVDPVYVESMLLGGPALNVLRGRVSLGAAPAQAPLSSALHSSPSLFRQLKLQNEGAVPVDVFLGQAPGASSTKFVLPASGQLEFPPEILGRHTIILQNTGAAVAVSSMLALW